MGNRGAGVPSWLREHWTTFPWILIPIRALHRKSLSQASLNISLLEDKTPRVLQPHSEMLWNADFPWHSAELRAAGN